MFLTHQNVFLDNQGIDTKALHIGCKGYWWCKFGVCLRFGRHNLYLCSWKTQFVLCVNVRASMDVLGI